MELFIGEIRSYRYELSGTLNEYEEGNKENFDLKLDRSFDFFIKFKKKKRGTVKNLLDLAKINKKLIEGVSYYQNSIEITFFKRTDMRQFESLCLKVKESIGAIIPNNVPIKFKGDHIKWSDQEFSSFLEKRFIKAVQDLCVI